MQQVLLRVLRLGWNPSASAGRTPRAVALRSVVDEARPAVLLAGAPSPDDLSDGAITAKVKSRLARDETIRSRDIHGATTDAVVTLSGHVTTEAERETAVKLARETEGVKSVVDRLEVKKAA
jgi:hyperosmotically inducible protein